MLLSVMTWLSFSSKKPRYAGCLLKSWPYVLLLIHWIILLLPPDCQSYSCLEEWNDGLVRVSAVNTIFMWRSVNINIPGSGPAYVGHIGIHHAAASCWLRICSCHIIRVIFGMTIYIRSDLDVSRVERGHNTPRALLTFAILSAVASSSLLYIKWKIGIWDILVVSYR